MRGGLAAMGRMRFNRRKEAKAAGAFFANAGFIGTKNPAGNDAGRGGNIGEAQATAKDSGPEEAVSAKAKSEASGGAEAVSAKANPKRKRSRKPQRNHRHRSQAKAKAKASGPTEVASGEAQASGHAEGVGAESPASLHTEAAPPLDAEEGASPAAAQPPPLDAEEGASPAAAQPLKGQATEDDKAWALQAVLGAYAEGRCPYPAPMSMTLEEIKVLHEQGKMTDEQFEFNKECIKLRDEISHGQDKAPEADTQREQSTGNGGGAEGAANSGTEDVKVVNSEIEL